MDYLWFAEYYREDIRRRTRRGIERARREGKRIGRPPVPREPILSMYREGYKITTIARTLKISRTTVYKVLKSAGVKK